MEVFSVGCATVYRILERTASVRLLNISRRLERETAEKQRESVVAVISTLAERGHLDMANIDVDGLLEQIGDSSVKKALEAAITDVEQHLGGVPSARPARAPGSEDLAGKVIEAQP